MKKELNELTEEQTREIVDLVPGREFISFSCDEAPLKNDGFFRVRIKLDDNYLLYIFSSGDIFLMDKVSILQPLNTLYIIDYLRCQGFYFENKFEKKVVINDENRLEMVKSYFKNISDEKLAELTEIAKKYSDIGPTVEEYFSNLSGNYPISNLSKLTSGKIWPTVDMVFSREKFHGIKVIDSPDLNFNLIEVIEATEHPLKQVEKGVRVYRVEWGTGTFTIIREDTSSDQIDVGMGDTILIKAGDYYKYKGRQLKLFEVNIKYP